MAWRYWSQQEESIMKNNYEELTPTEIAELLPKRTLAAIIHRLDVLKLFPTNRTCRYCEEKFKPKLRSQKYCCRKCNQLKQRERRLEDENIR